MLNTIGKKIIVSKHAKERMESRVIKGTEKTYMNRKYLTKKTAYEKIKFALTYPLGYKYYYTDEEGISHLFDKGYVEYVLAETADKITVITVIFHGSIRGREKLAELKGGK